MRKTILTLILAAGLAVPLTGCGEGKSNAPSAREQMTHKAAVAANEALAGRSDNAEIANIQKRLQLTSNPGQIGFVLLMNEAGQPIAYHAVKGKITSSGKRLTPPTQIWRTDCGQYCTQELGAAPSDEGTWGSSDPYIYFWTMDGQYVQWNGAYLYSDKPFRTRVEPLVISVDGGARG